MSTDCVLFDFATKNLHLATINFFLPLSRQMRLKDFVNVEPCYWDGLGLTSLKRYGNKV